MNSVNMGGGYKDVHLRIKSYLFCVIFCACFILQSKFPLKLSVFYVGDSRMMTLFLFISNVCSAKCIFDME